MKAPLASRASPDDACRAFAQRLPADYLVYAAGDSGSAPPRSVNIRINNTGQGIVLALGSDGPTLWRVQFGSANVVGVILSGNHRSSLFGLPSSVPVLRASRDDGAPCGYFWINADATRGANLFVSKLLVRAVDGYVSSDEHLVLIGNAVTGRTSQLPAPMQMSFGVDIGADTYSSPRNGRSLDVTGIIRSSCQGATDHCTVHCGNELAGDPDFGQVKSCQIIYSCANQTHTAKVMEGMNLQLRCD